MLRWKRGRTCKEDSAAGTGKVVSLVLVTDIRDVDECEIEDGDLDKA